MDNLTFFDFVIDKLNEKEKNTIQYCIFENESLIYHKSWMKKNPNCILIKILQSRLLEIEKIIGQKYSNYEKIISNKYCSIYKIDTYNYIFIEFVVNSHIYIPQFILKNFANKCADGLKIWYLTPEEFEIKQEKIKDYKSEYGYYSMRVEELLRDEYESKIGDIAKKIYDFMKNKKGASEIILSKEEIETIFNFIDISIYRNPKVLSDFKNYSISDKIINYTANDLITLANSNIINEHIFNDYRINVAINKTELNFVLNDTMLSVVNIKNNGKAIFVPIHPKFAICLLHKTYYTNWVTDEKLYYMNIEDAYLLQRINRYIYINAKNNKENTIGLFEDLKMLK